MANIENSHTEDSKVEMTDDESRLLNALKAEQEGAATYWQSEIVEQQRDAMEAYYGQAYGDEVEGRSQLVTREVFETIEWIRPDLIDMFSSSDRIVSIEPTSPEAETTCEIAQAYLNHIFFQEHDGLSILDHFAFDGLLQKLGLATVYVDTKQGKEETFDGINTAQLETITSNPRVAEVLEVVSEETEATDLYPDGMVHSVSVAYSDEKCLRFETVAPEDFSVSTRAVDLDSAVYKGIVRRMTRTEVAKRWPDKFDNIKEALVAGTGNLTDWDTRREARFLGEEDWENGYNASSHAEAQLLHVYEEYVWYDMDGDGIAEQYQVFRLDDFILEYAEVDEHPFACWTPIPIPHRLYGLSIYDIMKDLQRAQTVLLRATLDTTYQSVAPRIAVHENKVNLNDLMDVSAGAIIRTTAPPGEVMMPVKQPGAAADSLPVIQHIGEVSQQRTGVTRSAQGIDPDSLNKTATGLQISQDAAATRKRMIARNFGKGVQSLLQKAFKLLITQVDSEQMIRFDGNWVPVNPVEWSDGMRVVVDVGIGTGSREANVMNMQMVLGMQEKWAQTFGLNTPVVTPKHMHNAAEEIVRAMGYRSVDRFFGDVGNFQPPPPQANPAIQAKQQEMQLKAQESQIKMQADMQEAQAKLQLEREQGLAELELKREEMALEFQQKMAIAERELALKREIALAEIQLKVELGNEGGSLSTDVTTGGEPG